MELRENIKIVVEGIKKIEGKYYNCGGGNSRMRSENNKIVGLTDRRKTAKNLVDGREK